jgi:Toxin co-regulated pilus biosynthesis protein Q
MKLLKQGFVALVAAGVMVASSFANQQRDTLESTALRIAPKGWAIKFLRGVDWQLSPPTQTHKTSLHWKQSLISVAAELNLAVDINDADETIAFSKPERVAAPAVPMNQTKKAQVKADSVTTEQSPSASLQIDITTGELLSRALTRFAQQHSYTLVWRSPTDLSLSIPYGRAGKTFEDVVSNVMSDFRLLGVMYPENRVLVIRDPALKE